MKLLKPLKYFESVVRWLEEILISTKKTPIPIVIKI